MNIPARSKSWQVQFKQVELKMSFFDRIFVHLCACRGLCQALPRRIKR